MVYAQILLFVFLGIRLGISWAKDGQRRSDFDFIRELYFAAVVIGLIWMAGGLSILHTELLY